ncbi:Ribonuclease H [Abeliophyllum distichum]|uniref:Ribonuclease H n=1 Tax=Abeliophyllum distichum TaxID=126358 RepID=A0ABD1PHZ8_9LAMI
MDPWARLGAGAEILLISLDSHNLNCTDSLGVQGIETMLLSIGELLAGLRLAQEMTAKKLHIYSDSQLVVSQVNGTFTAREQFMVAYMKKVKDLLSHFEVFELLQILRIENGYANALFEVSE